MAETKQEDFATFGLVDVTGATSYPAGKGTSAPIIVDETRFIPGTYAISADGEEAMIVTHDRVYCGLIPEEQRTAFKEWCGDFAKLSTYHPVTRLGNVSVLTSKQGSRKIVPLRTALSKKLTIFGTVHSNGRHTKATRTRQTA